MRNDKKIDIIRAPRGSNPRAFRNSSKTHISTEIPEFIQSSTMPLGRDYFCANIADGINALDPLSKLFIIVSENLIAFSSLEFLFGMGRLDF